MRFITATLTFIVYAITTLSAVTPALLQAKRSNGQVKPNSYIVKLKEGVSKETVNSILGSHVSSITYDYDTSFFNGFAGVFADDVLNSLRASNIADYIADDGIMSAFDTQTDAPWSLARINSTNKLQNQDPFALTYTYKYNSNPGNGVDVYVVDTGIFVQHPDFQGRARWGATFGQGYSDSDGNGHGTHVAGTIGSLHYGVAKAVNLVAVKVLSDNGTGLVSDIIAGLQWVQSQAKASGRPSIATMSLGGIISLPLNDATDSVIKAGIHCTVAAGNDNTDAFLTSPASTAAAITVGATNITDARAYYSNYGSVVDIFAPGSNITSTWNDGGSHVISGTSMATPHVAGLVAYFISTNGNMSPADMSSFVKSHAVKDTLSNIPLLTPNALANNAV